MAAEARRPSRTVDFELPFPKRRKILEYAEISPFTVDVDRDYALFLSNVQSQSPLGVELRACHSFGFDYVTRQPGNPVREAVRCSITPEGSHEKMAIERGGRAGNLQLALRFFAAGYEQAYGELPEHRVLTMPSEFLDIHRQQSVDPNDASTKERRRPGPLPANQQRRDGNDSDPHRGVFRWSKKNAMWRNEQYEYEGRYIDHVVEDTLGRRSRKTMLFYPNDYPGVKQALLDIKTACYIRLMSGVLYMGSRSLEQHGGPPQTPEETRAAAIGSRFELYLQKPTKYQREIVREVLRYVREILAPHCGFSADAAEKLSNLEEFRLREASVWALYRIAENDKPSQINAKTRQKTILSMCVWCMFLCFRSLEYSLLDWEHFEFRDFYRRKHQGQPIPEMTEEFRHRRRTHFSSLRQRFREENVGWKDAGQYLSLEQVVRPLREELEAHDQEPDSSVMTRMLVAENALSPQTYDLDYEHVWAFVKETLEEQVEESVEESSYEASDGEFF